MPRGDGSGERKGAAYTVSTTHSHDYSGTEQSPHHTVPIRSAQFQVFKRGELADEIAAHPEDYRDD